MLAEYYSVWKTVSILFAHKKKKKLPNTVKKSHLKLSCHRAEVLGDPVYFQLIHKQVRPLIFEVQTSSDIRRRHRLNTY